MAGMHEVIYFRGAGRAFVTRTCLSAGNVPYKNTFITFPELLEMRGPKGYNETVPLGSLPILKLPSGKLVVQSGAHMRYAAKKAGLYPRDDDEAALCIDEIVFTALEVQDKCPMPKDPVEKEKQRKDWAADVVPKYATFLSNKLGAGPFYGGASPNLADLCVYTVTDAIASGQYDFVPPTTLEPFPALNAHHTAMKAHPLIVEHGKLKE